MRLVVSETGVWLAVGAGKPVWSRRVDPVWLADQLEAEALARWRELRA